MGPYDNFTIFKKSHKVKTYSNFKKVALNLTFFSLKWLVLMIFDRIRLFKTYRSGFMTKLVIKKRRGDMTISEDQDVDQDQVSASQYRFNQKRPDPTGSGFDLKDPNLIPSQKQPVMNTSKI
jgi:hypothetical protein